MKEILAISPDELEAEFKAAGFEAYRARQARLWALPRAAVAFDAMHNLPLALRAWLEKHYTLSPLAVESETTSPDGTRKFLFRLADGAAIESVLMPGERHWSLCVSSQVGCALDCRFCATAAMGFRRNLSAAEIIAQVLFARRTLGERDGDQLLTNIVFMGMGEPLINFKNIERALAIILAADGLDMSHRRITVSTAGYIPGIRRLAQSALNVSLAVSLNAPSQSLRVEIMPAVARKYPLDELIAACRDYPLPNRRRITFEYVLLGGVNMSDDDARATARLLRGIRCKVNLIPFNEMPGLPYSRPSEDAISRFGEIMRDANLTVTVRRSKGADIRAACGQLAVKAT
jgi:23S rRNA (adenine2503-C2)-methyltransferase